MRYDFQKVVRAFHESGKTLQQLDEATGVPYSTIIRVFKTNRAHQSTAAPLLKYFGLEFKDILPKQKRRMA
jgi:hypothetical protein